MKPLVWIIAVLNAMDALLTYGGLKLVFIEELNPLMVFLWNLHPFLFLFVKLLFSIFLLFLFLHKKFQPFYRDNFIKKIKILLIFALIIYIFIFFNHVIWVFFYFFLKLVV